MQNPRQENAGEAAPTPRILHGDCVSGMLHLPPSQAHLVLADPPYNVGVREGGKAAAWDTMDTDAFLSFTRAWVRAAMHVLRPGGALLVWGSPNNTMLSRLTLVAVDEVGFDFVQECAWTYQQGGDGRLQTMRAYATRHERLLWFEKRGGDRYFDAKRIATPYSEEERRIARQKGGGRLREDSLQIGKPPWSWFHVPRVNSMSSERRFGSHPSMKPVEVGKRLILAHCPPDGGVVIPFGGSGSEAVALSVLESEKEDGTRATRRSCVVFEVDEAYCDVALRRLDSLHQRNERDRGGKREREADRGRRNELS